MTDSRSLQVVLEPKNEPVEFLVGATIGETMMHSRKRIQFTLGLFLSMLVVAPVVARQEGIIFDPQTGNYIITYEYDGQVQQSIYVPSNKINPVLISRFNFTTSGDIAYRYILKNSKDSQQNVESLDILAISAKGATISTNAPKYLLSQPTAETALALSTDGRKVGISTPAGWRGFVLPNINGTGLQIGWSYWDDKITGLRPGNSQSGFGYESQDLPGVGLAGIRGNAPTLSFSGYGPSQKISDQLSAIEREVGGVDRPVAVPAFSVPSPFNAATILKRLQKHTNIDLIGFKLIDSVLVSQLDLRFSGAIAAAQGGNTPSLLHEIKNLRQLLKQEHADVDKDDDGDQDNDDTEMKAKPRVDKLAARVLDFDLKYVEKRVKGDND